MSIEIKLWGQVRILCGQEKLQVDHSGDLEALLQLIAVDQTAIAPFIVNDDGSANQSTLIFINGTQCDRQNSPLLKDGDQVTIMSPIAGG